jgi:acetyltransferase-like isoleucine patch superfamily enzyme
MGGVSIGEGAVVGANAVVTKDVAAYEIVAGIPAKVVGHRTPGDRRDDEE